ncbi:hypothetical protein O3M35_003687 [Rhynocoris fuscipes]|uniref:Uncharacterized protein n=1 Tax=Rhynocoris fuscipes TaxID=488301 RepID=A0AAW1CN97_9HEMI
MPEKVVIVGAVRSPIGSFCGSLSSLKASDLGCAVIKEVLKRTNIAPADLNEVIMGQVLQAGEGQNPARQSAVKAGIPYSVPACTVNLLCGSGLKTVAMGYQSIVAGDNKIILCGGQEAMSRAPHTIHIRNPLKSGDATLKDSLLADGLTDAFVHIHMGETAENVAKMYKITRGEQDAFAVKSQEKTKLAQTSGHFDKEIVPISIETKKGTTLVEHDEFPKPGTTLEVLSKLRPNFDKEGTVTAGNSSGVNDGAAAVILTTESEAKSRGLPILAEVVGWSHAGCDPSIMGMGPVPAVNNLLKKIGWSKDEVDLYELNEAFAAQSIGVLRDLNVDESKVNVCGGAISLGHPIGASGTRILVTLIYSLHRLGKSKGVAALCIGGGQGIALAVQVPSA